MADGKYYGHHPSPNVADPADLYSKTETDTLTQQASANAYNQSNSYTDTQISIIETLVATVSANTLEEADNGWDKNRFTMTTTTSGVSGYPIGIVFDDHTVFFKVHVLAAEFGAPPTSGNGGAWHLEAAFYKEAVLNAVQLGSTVSVFEHKTDEDWDVGFQQMGINDEVVEIYVNGGVGQIIQWTITVEWLLGAPV